jgi:hypothetical protein
MEKHFLVHTNSDYVEIEYYTDNTLKNSVIESGYLIDKQLDKDGKGEL